MAEVTVTQSIIETVTLELSEKEACAVLAVLNAGANEAMGDVRRYNGAVYGVLGALRKALGQ